MDSTQWHEANAAVEHFGAQTGLEQCSLDERGTALLAFDDVPVSLLLDETNGALLLLATIGRPPASAQTYGWLLDANLFWAATHGATVARDVAAGTIFLQQSLPVAGLQSEHLEAALQRFVTSVEELRRRLGQTDAGPSPDDRGELTSFMQHLVRA
ncbi:type III secretion system chaperone [Peristeroidobacter soli]|uniref:type III secretion system chaperone n=1 Tax=Peristeroidobacter soli TaxID=2497877 RepID=UPI00101D75CC|nr:type III secretion system chaperone [Peristeroidobacter soli]